MARNRSVTIKLNFDDSGAVRSIEGLDGRISEVNRKTGDYGRAGVAAFAKLAAGIGAVTLAVGTMTRALRVAYDFLESSVAETAKTRDDIAKMARSLGLATEELSSYRLAAKLGGTDIETFGVGLRTLARNAYDASTGTGEAKEAFEELGIAVAGSSGELRSTKALLLDVADRFAGMENSSRKTALAMEIFGRSGTSLINVLNLGREGLEDLEKKARSLGIVFDEETAIKAEKFNDELAILGLPLSPKTSRR